MFRGWHFVEHAGEGRLLVLRELQSVSLLDAASRLVWSAPLSAHHDVRVLPGGTFLVLTSALRWTEGAAPEPFVDNVVVELDGAGRERTRTSLYDVLRRSPLTRKTLAEAELRLKGWRASQAEVQMPWSLDDRQAALGRKILATIRSLESSKTGYEPFALMALHVTQADILHANSVERLDRDVAGLGFEGDLLVSMRELDLVVCIDARTGVVRWAWGGGIVDGQHSASVTRDDRLLLFDNGVATRNSRAVLVDPSSRKILWRWPSSRSNRFFTQIMGAAEEVPNGNLLITDSLAGRLLEVTGDGEIVWEYLEPPVGKRRKPALAGPRALDEALVGTIYRARYVAPEALGWLSGRRRNGRADRPGLSGTAPPPARP